MTSWDSPRVIGVNAVGTTVLSTQRGVPHRTLGTPFRLNDTSTYSVDGDDGLLGDFMGNKGNSWTTLNTVGSGLAKYIEFRFDRDEQGRLPTYVGFVVTEVFTTFNEFEWSTAPGPQNPETPFNPLTWYPVRTFLGDTRSHRFFGLHSPAGIERLVLDNISQVDHLEYGYAIPEPGGTWLSFTGLAMLLRRRRLNALQDHGG